MSNIEKAISLALEQHGVFATFQLKELEMSDSSIHALVHNTMFSKVSRGVYALHSSSVVWHSKAFACVLASGPNALLSHESALINLELLRKEYVSCRMGLAIPFHVTLSRTSSRRVSSSVHRSIYKDELFPKTIVNLIPQVPVEIALIESARHMPEQFFCSAVDSAIRKRLTNPRKIQQALRLLWPAPGRSKSRVEEIIGSYLKDAKNFAKTESVLEARILRIVSSITATRIETQYQVFTAGSRYRIDIAIPDAKLAIEVDGFEFHHGREVFDQDKKRQNDLVAAGWTILRFTASQSDEEIKSQITQLLSRWAG